MMVNTTTPPVPVPVSSNQKAWLVCIGLQAISGILSIFSVAASNPPLAITILLGVTGGIVSLLTFIRPLRVSAHNQVHAYKKWLILGWFIGSLLALAVHPALWVIGLFPLIQFQRFLPKFKTTQVPWLVGGAVILLVGINTWHLLHNTATIQLMVNRINLPLWVASCLPPLLYYALTQVHLSTMLAVQQGVLMQQSTLALTDALTGLGNRRYFDETLSREMARTKRNASPLSLVLLDIDFFKKINDVYGHTTGDTVLKELATLIASNLRQCDWIARYGGEEYALILPDTPCLEALKLLERLRLLVEKYVFDRGHSPMKITVSLGITQYDVKRHTLSSFIAEADEALYEAKHHGRNQVRVYGLGAAGDTLVNPQAVMEARHVSLYTMG